MDKSIVCMPNLMRRLIGLLLVPLGIGLMPLTFFTSSTAVGCDGFNPDFLGIEFSRAEITGVNLQTMTVYWYDGCNWHNGSLLLFAGTLCLVIAGLFLLVGPMARQMK